jgi:hypothetical protein
MILLQQYQGFINKKRDDGVGGLKLRDVIDDPKEFNDKGRVFLDLSLQVAFSIHRLPTYKCAHSRTITIFNIE